jgi:hypothetical protein
VFNQGKHYGIPGILADGQNVQDTMRIGRAAIQHVRNKGPAILQVHTFRFNGHSPADPEHERNRKDEKRWARATCDPIKIFEESDDAKKVDQKAALARARDEVAKALAFANASPPPPKDLAAKLEYPDPTGEVDYSAREPEMGLELAAAVTKATVPEATLTALAARIDALRAMAGSSYNIPANTQQAFGTLRAADEIIDEGHFIGKARSVHWFPLRPRSRGERRFLRTLPGVSLRPGSLAFNPRPRRLSTPTDAFQLHPRL